MGRGSQSLFTVVMAAVLCCLGDGIFAAESGKNSNSSDSSKARDERKSVAEKAPEWMDKVTLLRPGKQPRLKPCKIRYSLSWNHLINAGEASILMWDGKKEDGQPNGVLTGEANARSSGAARILWTYDCELKSEVDKYTYRPIWFEHTETENREKVSYRTDFKSDRVVTMRHEVEPETGKVKSKKRTFRYANVYDLLSAILCLRSLPLKNGKTITGVIQPFDSPYLVSFDVQGRETRKYQGEDQETIRMGVRIQKINKDLSLGDYKKMKTATLWVSEDEYRLPLEIRADIFIGYVAATLVERDYLTEAENKNGVLAESPGKSGFKAIISNSAIKMRQWWREQKSDQEK